MPEPPTRCQRCHRVLTREQTRILLASWSTVQDRLGGAGLTTCEPCSVPVVDALKAVLAPRPARPAPPDGPPIWEVIARIGEAIPPEERAKLPRDLARNLDHYLYGTPKKNGDGGAADA